MFELNIEKSWCDAVYARSSVRKYTGAPDKAQLDRLMQAFTHLQEYMEEVVGKNYDHLPKSPYSPVSPFSR